MRSYFLLTNNLNRISRIISGCLPNCRRNATTLGGAKIRGIFLEGPFFCEKYKGAQNPKYMGDPKSEILDEWQERAGGWVKKIAIAPEREGAVDFIKHAKTKDIYVALAHTDATYEDCKKRR